MPRVSDITPSWIAVDWGTSRLRTWAIGADGGVLASACSDKGMRALDPSGFEPALMDLVGGWLPASGVSPMEVIICGMAGARGGWREASYRRVPCRAIDDGEMLRFSAADRRLNVNIIAGLSQSDPPDVMRGEETQLAGFVALHGLSDAVVCLPGTHSKWVRLDGGNVASFQTVMTGELFDLLANQSVLRQPTASGANDNAAFLAAVDTMVARRQDLVSSLFSVRAATVLTGGDADTVLSRLSGLLIGAELAATRTFWNENDVHLVGGDISARYAEALSHVGAAVFVEDAIEMTLTGLRAAHAILIERAA